MPHHHTPLDPPLTMAMVVDPLVRTGFRTMLHDWPHGRVVIRTGPNAYPHGRAAAPCR